MSFSALATLALGAALVIPLLLPAIALYERIIDPRTKLSRSRTALCVAVVLWLECLGLVAAAALWVFFLGRRRHPGWDSAHHRLQWGWAKLNFSALKKIFGLELQVTAAEQGQAGPYLLLLNHTSIADTLLASIVLSGPYGMAFRYVLREGLLWDPCLDVVGLRLPNVFLNCNHPGGMRFLKTALLMMVQVVPRFHWCEGDVGSVGGFSADKR